MLLFLLEFTEQTEDVSKEQQIDARGNKGKPRKVRPSARGRGARNDDRHEQRVENKCHQRGFRQQGIAGDTLGVERNDEDCGNRKAETDPGQDLLFLMQPLILRIHIYAGSPPWTFIRYPRALRFKALAAVSDGRFMIRRAALKRLLTFSLSKIFVRWVLTVFSLMKMRLPISSFVKPSATRRSISCSRFVSVLIGSAICSGRALPCWA